MHNILIVYQLVTQPLVIANTANEFLLLISSFSNKDDLILSTCRKEMFIKYAIST